MTYYEHSKYRNCDGVIIASIDFKDPDVIKLVESEIPTVTIDHIFNNRTAILSDNIRSMMDIVNYVTSQGHRRIAFIHGEDTYVTQQRLASFRKACLEHKLIIPDEYIKEAIYHDPRSSGLMTRELLTLKEPPTCILYPDDFSFIGGMNEIEKHGLSIPSDISVVGYDGILLSQVLRPRLTTYRQNVEEIGKTAADKLIDMIENPKLFIPEQIIISGEVIVGDTVKMVSKK
jgi:LacI family transcriptional regulator